MSGAALPAVAAAGIDHEVIRHRPARGLAEPPATRASRSATWRGRTVGLGAGERGVAPRVAADDAVAALDATVADVTDSDDAGTR